MITDIYDKGDVRPLGPRSPVNCGMDSQDQLWDWTMFFPSVHVHEQRRVYMGNVGLPIHVFARKSVLHVVARCLAFWPKSLARTMFWPSFHVHGQRRVTDTRFARNSVLRIVARLLAFWP